MALLLVRRIGMLLYLPVHLENINSTTIVVMGIILRKRLRK
jgi:hypothetical protein